MKMDREQFEELMLSDQKIFAGYAKLFMILKITKIQGFLDWCWEKYQEGIQPSSAFDGLGDDCYSTGAGSMVSPEIRV
jgi:hypothetical protein